MTKEFYEDEGFSKYTVDSIEKSLHGNSRFNVFVKKIFEVLDKKENISVLDIGCGEGALVCLIQKKYQKNQYYGTDISETAISNAQRNLKGISFCTNDFNKRTSYDDCSFDLIACGEVIEHLHDTDNFFEEVKRILNAGGYVIISTPNLSSWIGRAMLLFGYLPPSMEVSNRSRQFGRKIFYREPDSQSVGHIKSFTWHSLEDLAEYYGFEVISHKGAWFRDIWINKLVTYLFPALSQEQVIVLKKQAPHMNH